MRRLIKDRCTHDGFQQQIYIYNIITYLDAWALSLNFKNTNYSVYSMYHGIFLTSLLIYPVLPGIQGIQNWHTKLLCFQKGGELRMILRINQSVNQVEDFVVQLG